MKSCSGDGSCPVSIRGALGRSRHGGIPAGATTQAPSDAPARKNSAYRADIVLVLLLGHETFELALILDPDLHEPAAPGRILVHGAGRALEFAIDLDDLAGDRRI